MKRRPTKIDPRVARSRATIIAAALELMVERGVAATTIEAVSKHSGVAKTTIYRQWTNQQGLVLDAFGTLLDIPAVPDTGTLRGDLLELVTGLIAALNLSPAAVLMPALIDAAERDEAFAVFHHEEAVRRHQAVTTTIIRGVHRGELPPDCDPADVVDLLAGPVFYRRYVSQGAVDEGFASTVVDHVLTALQAPSKPHAGPIRIQAPFNATDSAPRVRVEHADGGARSGET
jgi:AcrR family transcriptional regulator